MACEVGKRGVAGGLGHTVPLLRPAKEIPRGKTPEQNPATWLEARNAVPGGKRGAPVPPTPTRPQLRAGRGGVPTAETRRVRTAGEGDT